MRVCRKGLTNCKTNPKRRTSRAQTYRNMSISAGALLEVISHNYITSLYFVCVVNNEETMHDCLLRITDVMQDLRTKPSMPCLHLFSSSPEWPHSCISANRYCFDHVLHGHVWAYTGEGDCLHRQLLLETVLLCYYIVTVVGIFSRVTLTQM